MLKKASIIDSFKKVGLCSDDVVMMHSSYKSIAPVEGGPKTVLEAIMEVIGDNGTLIMPTFNFDFCLGEPYDKINTPSHMGILTEMVRLDPRSYKVHHPIYSFAVIGKLAQPLGEISSLSSFGSDSLLAAFHKLDGKILAIGVPYQKSFTFIHYVEQTVGCNYRFIKEFNGKIINEDGTVDDITCDMNVRKIDMGVDTYIEPMGERVEKLGVVKVEKIGNTFVKMASAKSFFEATKDIPIKEPHLLRRITENPRIHYL